MSDEQRPPQHQPHQPGQESQMHPPPRVEDYAYIGSGKLTGKVALITGGDSGIGRAVAIAFAKEGAEVAIDYLNEEQDAQATQQRIEQLGRHCLCLPGDIGQESFGRDCIDRVQHTFHHLDVLINNAAEQHVHQDISQLTAEQLLRTFQINLFSMFYFVKAALPHLKAGSAIINTTSVTAFRGRATLIDYAATKGAIVSFTRSLASALVDKGIRVNGVAPGPVWTPLIPASMDEARVAQFGSQVPMHRPAEPCEIAPCYVFLASNDASYMTGQTLHPNGGEAIGD